MRLQANLDYGRAQNLRKQFAEQMPASQLCETELEPRKEYEFTILDDEGDHVDVSVEVRGDEEAWVFYDESQISDSEMRNLLTQ